VRPIPFDPELHAIPAGAEREWLTPALIVFMDAVRENVRRLIARASPDRLRVHVKTTKIPEVFAEIACAGVRAFKCATPREMEHLLACLRGHAIEGDVLVAYPHTGPNLARIGDLARADARTRVSILIEDPDAVAEVPPHLGIFVDVNPGMNRTGVPMADRRRIAEVKRRAGDRFRGVHHYEGHVHSAPFAERKATCEGLYADLAALCSELGGVPEVVTSGTPSFAAALDSEHLRGLHHRVSPGTVVFHDLRTHEECEELDFVPAAVVLSRVVSHPSERRVTCDAGSKAIAAEAGDPIAAALGRPGIVAETPNEEHLPFRVIDGEAPRRGDTLLLFPRHVCPTVNLAEEAVLIDGGASRVVPVKARAHDVVPGRLERG
jgi:D-serine deaminase-like pyridoxal phosphate-dependent protein